MGLINHLHVVTFPPNEGVFAGECGEKDNGSASNVCRKVCSKRKAYNRATLLLSEIFLEAFALLSGTISSLLCSTKDLHSHLLSNLNVIDDDGCVVQRSVLIAAYILKTTLSGQNDQACDARTVITGW
jgi:hypothetical protein